MLVIIDNRMSSRPVILDLISVVKYLPYRKFVLRMDVALSFHKW